MKNLGLLLSIGALALGGAVGVNGACAIDDDIAWITGEECTGSCRMTEAADLACDTGPGCTNVEGCDDWDCTEDTLPGGGPIPDAPADGADTFDGIDVGVNPDECEALGGGVSLDAAQELTLDVTQAELVCCPTDSRWFRFAVPAGTRFAVDVVPLAGAQVTFLLYSEDEAVLAGAEMDAESSFAAEAATGATYYLRVRALGDTTASYSLTVRTVVD